ncbi:p-hydroxyphenylacetate 3-hydroxylase reductase component [Thorsellia kenyensis]|uniref:p-hydroxyphenylacetate 3-hydroxylase reductase component n=1 Tax=Thorsellia kenyensis TaxID=1549888 RepID=A0ABV6CBP7_9GAMM
MTTIFDSKSFRRALGNFATGVVVVTAQDEDGNKVGMTVNSFTSVSLEPPLVLWCIDKRAGSLDVFKRAGHFAINILSADQIDISNTFARSKEDRFASIDYKEGIGKSLLISDVSAQFECELHEILEGGDHLILVGKVLNFNDFGRVPLLYHQGAYASVFPHPNVRNKIETANEKNSESKEVNQKLAGNIHYLLTQAVQNYQNDYYPKQLASGLRNSEARILLVIYAGLATCKSKMTKEAAIPMREIEQAVEILVRKGLLIAAEDELQLTEKGEAQAIDLLDIAERHQEEVLARYKPEEVVMFKKMLMALL